MIDLLRDGLFIATMILRFSFILLLMILPAAAVTADDSTGTAILPEEPANLPDSACERAGLEKLMALLNLMPGDLHFRDDYTEIDSFRLATVAAMMDRPMDMAGYTEAWKDIWRSEDPGKIMSYAFANLARSGQSYFDRARLKSPAEKPQTGINIFYKSLDLNRLLMKLDNYLYDYLAAARDSVFSGLSAEEYSFLAGEMVQVILEDTADEFRTVAALDSIQDVKEGYVERFVEFGTGIEKDFLLSAGISAAADIFNDISFMETAIRNGELSISEILSDTAVVPERTGLAEYLGKHPKWKIGGLSDDVYDEDYHVIIDFGGNDRYELSYDLQNPHPTIIIDFSGNDIYQGRSDYAIASGFMNVGLLFDLGGDDVYNGRNFSCGSGYFGLGLLYDGGGADKYYGDTHCQGAGSFGLGLIIDLDGGDLYSGALYCQGFGMTEGLGMIVDYHGSDSYIAGNRYKEYLGLAGENVHYLSLSQGFGLGFRPYMSGGIGMIADFDGNDNYLADIFGQGCSYWWALGVIYDADGNDRYVAHQYAQGAGIHMSSGILFDQRGDDYYYGKGLMQGCGHDYGCGLILDRNGNDIYQAYDLSQAAGSANGFGLLIDNRGNDAYLVLRKNNTQGYGNPRRDFGSLGLFMDLQGTDQYYGNGMDNGYWKTDSKWGGGMDLDMIDAEPAAEQNE